MTSIGVEEMNVMKKHAGPNRFFPKLFVNVHEMQSFYCWTNSIFLNFKFQVGKIYFDAKRECKDDCYVGLATNTPGKYSIYFLQNFCWDEQTRVYIAFIFILWISDLKDSLVKSVYQYSRVGRLNHATNFWEWNHLKLMG